MRPTTLPTGRTPLLATLVLLASALVLAGCLGGGDLGGADEEPANSTSAAAAGGEPSPEAAALAAAATRTTQTGSAKLEVTIAVSLPGAPERVDVRLTGALDLDSQRGRLVFDYGGLLAALPPGSEQVGALLPDRMVFEQDAVYLRMPNLAQLVPDAKKWIKLDAADLAAQQGLDATGVDQLGQADPTQLLDLLESIDGAIQDLGPDDVRGAAATHYRATIDMARLAATAPPEQQAAMQGQLDQLSQFGLDQLPVDVWVDGEGRVVRMNSTIVVPDTETGGGTIELDIELYDFGAPVEVNTPAPGNVASIDTLLGALGPTIQG